MAQAEEEDKMMLKELTMKAQQNCKLMNIQNSYLSKIFAKLQELNFDRNFYELAHHHASSVKVALLKKETNGGKFYFNSADECISFCISKFFFEHVNLYPTEVYPKNVDYTYPILAPPIEMFLKPDDEARVTFESNLKKNDVLYVEIVNTNCKYKDTELLEARIIEKTDMSSQTDTLVYSMNIHAFMFKNLELQRLVRDEILPSEILKVVLLGSRKEKEWKHYVTTNAANLGPVSDELKSSLSLGIIPAKELSFDFKLIIMASQYPSYAHFLRNQPQFRNTQLKDQIQSIGLDPYQIYSFNREREGLTFPTINCIEKLKELAKLDLHDESRKCLKVAETYVKKADYANAEIAYNKAVKYWPENYKAYELRGKMFVDQSKYKKHSLLQKALFDFETALKLNPSAVPTKEELSKMSIYFANRNKDKLERAKKCATFALKLNSEEPKAVRLLQIIDKRSAKKISLQEKADAMDLKTLEKKKKKLEMRLKKEKI